MNSWVKTNQGFYSKTMWCKKLLRSSVYIEWHFLQGQCCLLLKLSLHLFYVHYLIFLISLDQLKLKQCPQKETNLLLRTNDVNYAFWELGAPWPNFLREPKGLKSDSLSMSNTTNVPHKKLYVGKQQKVTSYM